jgi:hypothetical protein
MDIARKFNAPIIVLDRIQCFSDLRITSGRQSPSGKQNVDVHRIYLSERTVPDGDYPPEMAYSHLRDHLAALSRFPLIILEGGSMSLTRRLLDDNTLLSSYSIFFDIIRRDPTEHSKMVLARVFSMVSPPNGSDRSVISELITGWRHVEQRPFLGSIVGLDAVLSWLAKNALRVEDLTRENLSRPQLQDLSIAVAESHLQYAQSQQRLFDTLAEQMECHLT